MVPPQPRLPSPPPGDMERERSPKPSLPSLPLLPPPRGPLQFVVTASRQKKKFCRMSQKKKIRNRAKKPASGLKPDGIIKLRPEATLALPLRQPQEGKHPAPSGPSPMDLRNCGGSQASEANPRPRPGAAKIRFPSFPQGVSSQGQAGEPGAAPTCGARAGAGGTGRAPSRGAERGRGIPGVRSAGPGGGRSAAGSPGDPQTWEAATWSAARRGPGTPEDRAAPRSGERVRGGSGSAGGDGARGEEGQEAGGREELRERPSQQGGEGRRHLRPRALPPRPARKRAGRRAGERRGRRDAEPRRAGPGRAAGVAASSLRAARPGPTMLPACGGRRQVGAGRRPRAPRAGPQWPGSD